MTLICEPHLAETLRTTYGAVLPGYHMNKRHWNTAILDGTIADDEVCEMIAQSYPRVVKGLRKADREHLSGLVDSNGH